MSRNLSLFVCCRSVGWNMMARIPFLDGIAGNRAAIRPMLGDSYASLPTILTGKTPQEHGHFGWFHYTPASSPFNRFRFVRHLPSSLRNSRWLRAVIEDWTTSGERITGRFSLYNIPLEHLPLFEITERHDLLAPGGLERQQTLIDWMGLHGLKWFCSENGKDDVENADSLAESLEQGAVDAAFIVLNGFDYDVRVEGVHSPGLRGRMGWADYRIRGLYETASHTYDRVDLVVFSDTDMLPVSRTYDLQRMVRQSGYTYGRDYVAFYEPALARFWFSSDDCRTAFRQMLDVCECGTILSNEELERQGCRFADGRFGEMLFVADHGKAFFPNFISDSPPRAASGYLPTDARLEAGLVCNLADVKLPGCVADVYELLAGCIEDSAGLKPAERVELIEA